MTSTAAQVEREIWNAGSPPSPSVSAVGSRRDYAWGICLLLCVVFLWTSSNFLTQDILHGGFEKPFFITYVSTSAFALYLLPFALRGAVKSHVEGRANVRSQAAYQPLNTDATAESSIPSDQGPLGRAHGNSRNDELPPLTTAETAQLAAWFCLLWFIANWSLNASLGYTSVASATILSSMSGFFTLGIGRVFRVETLTVVKIGAVLASFGGVLLVSLADSSVGGPSPAPTPTSSVQAVAGDKAPILGDFLALLSALFYALYVVLLKVRIRSESRIDMQLFFGFVGLFNIISCWPLGIILHVTGVEPFEIPHAGRTIATILINMAITLSSDYIYVIAMLKTTPLVVTIGLSLTMPLAVLGDFLLKKPVQLQVILGAAVVLLSFVTLGLEDSKNEEKPDLISGRPLEEERRTGSLMGSPVHLDEDVTLQ